MRFRGLARISTRSVIHQGGLCDVACLFSGTWLPFHRKTTKSCARICHPTLSSKTASTSRLATRAKHHGMNKSLKVVGMNTDRQPSHKTLLSPIYTSQPRIMRIDSRSSQNRACPSKRSLCQTSISPSILRTKMTLCLTSARLSASSVPLSQNVSPSGKTSTSDNS